MGRRRACQQPAAVSCQDVVNSNSRCVVTCPPFDLSGSTVTVYIESEVDSSSLEEFVSQGKLRQAGPGVSLEAVLTSVVPEVPTTGDARAVSVNKIQVQEVRIYL